MKQCPSCGFECEDEVRFCTECGAAFPENKEEKKEPDFFVSSTPAPAAAGRQQFLKELSSSKLATVLVLAITVALICSIAAALLVPGVLSQYVGKLPALIEEYAGEYLGEVPAEVNEAIDLLSENGIKVNAGSAISSRLFPILTAIGLWIVFISAKSKDRLCCNATGFNIVRVIKIIGLVARILLFALCAFLLAIIAAAIGEAGYGEYSSIPLGILVFYAVIFLFALFYFIGTIRTLKTLACIADGKDCKVRISGYAAFIYTVSGIIGLIGAVSLAAAGGQSYIFFVFAIAAVASAIGDLAAGKFIRRCKELKKL